MSRRHARNWLLAPVAVVLAASAMAASVGAVESTPGSAGVDTSLPLTESAVTVKGRGEFADLEITVNQTKNLTHQAVSITWQGGAPTLQAGARFGGNFLQIMQCWGEDDGTVPENPGPPPEQCVMGGTAGTQAGPSQVVYPSALAVSRVISRSIWPNFDPDVGFKDPGSINVWRPFRAVDGTVINAHVDPTFNASVSGGNFWLNPYFDSVTTNEIAAGATAPDGRGAEIMEINTGVESSGLGCGQKLLEGVGGELTAPTCWIVIVPRGTAAEENVGTTDSDAVGTSPLAPEAWRNRIAVEIEFNPVDSPCSIARTERRIAGNELLLGAIASWQPALCEGLDLPPFSYASVGDVSARQQLTSTSAGAPGMVAISRPLDSLAVDDENPVVYAPLTISGVVVGFNIERSPRFDAPPGAQALRGVRIAELNLTPRLVAKLLTQSYVQSVTVGNSTPAYDWLGSNSAHLGVDPDFLRFNPEFALLNTSGRYMAGLSLPSGTSDAVQQVWEWILNDPEARRWLDGQPDEWGMVVNPVYATVASRNSTGFAFGSPVPNTFPKADPFCFQAAVKVVGGAQIVPPLLCGTDWRPYARGFNDAAYVTRAASDGARTVGNPFPISASNAWSRDAPQTPGDRTMLSITDSPSAELLGIQSARLSASGDNGPDRSFVPPSAGNFLAAVNSSDSLISKVTAEAARLDGTPAYPLTAVTYAATRPLSLDAEARTEYAAFLDYAGGPGQTVGPEPGQLPRGYAPLPASMAAQTSEAARAVRELQPTTVEPAPTTPIVPVAEASDPTGAPPVAAPPPQPPTSRGPAPRTTVGRRTSTPEIASVPDATAVPEVAEPEPTEAASSVPVAVEPSATVVGTPATAVGRARYAVPGFAAASLASALIALEVTKRPRRSAVADGVDS